MPKPLPVNPGVRAREKARQLSFQAPPVVVPPPPPGNGGERRNRAFIPPPLPPMNGGQAGGAFGPPPPAPYFAPNTAVYESQRQGETLPAGFWWLWSAGSVLPFLESLVLIISGNFNLFTVLLLLIGIANIVLALLTAGYTSLGTGTNVARTFALITGWLSIIGFGLLCCVGVVHVLSFVAPSP